MDYPHKLKDVYDTIVGYSTKSLSSATKFVKKHFVHGDDYIIKREKNDSSGRINENIYITDQCLKRWIIAARPRDAPGKASTVSLDGITVITRKLTPEGATICNIAKALAFYKPIFQFNVKARGRRYKIDLYFPVNKVAVECDENGHADRDAAAEKEREEAIVAELNCVFVRFNPDDPDFCLFGTIDTIVCQLNRSTIE